MQRAGRAARHRRPTGPGRAAVLSALLGLVILAVGLPLALRSGGGGSAAAVARSTTRPASTPSSAPSSTAASPGPSRLLPAYSLTDPASPWVVVDKLRPLTPRTYAPGDLVPVGSGQLMRRAAAGQLLGLIAAAKEHGLTVFAASGYRSYSYQAGVHDRLVASRGQERADEGSARPGYSEHQTGWAVDVAGGGCVVADCFADTPEGRWVAANAYRWGFLVRYPPGLEAITGYRYEPWHLRYVGVALASAMRDAKVPTLEQWFHLPPAPSYPGSPAGDG